MGRLWTRTNYAEELQKFCEELLIELEDEAAAGGPAEVKVAEAFRKVWNDPVGRLLLLQALAHDEARQAMPQRYDVVRQLTDFEDRNEWGNA